MCGIVTAVATRNIVPALLEDSPASSTEATIRRDSR